MNTFACVLQIKESDVNANRISIFRCTTPCYIVKNNDNKAITRGEEKEQGKRHEGRGSGKREEEVEAREREGSSPAPPGLTSCLIILDLCNQREAGGGHSCAAHILISSNLARPGAALRRSAAADANGACGSETGRRRARVSLWALAQLGLQVEMGLGEGGEMRGFVYVCGVRGI